MNHLTLSTPHDFSFEEALVYLGRSEQDILHRIEDGHLYKLVKIKDTHFLIRVTHSDQKLRIEFLTNQPNAKDAEVCAKAVWEILDLDRNLLPFYHLAKQDKVLKPLVEKYQGLRIVGIDDLFETIAWAIIGQQINLTFAYTLKKRLIETFGEHQTHDGHTYWLFPTPERMASISVNDLTELQFTTRKAEYIIGVAKLMANGELTKDSLHTEPPDTVLKRLVSIRGIGPWTAHYVMMRCLHIPSAFPISDVGLHNALKAQLNLIKKPTIPEIEAMATKWEGWQAYATFYLWRSLHD